MPSSAAGSEARLRLSTLTYRAQILQRKLDCIRKSGADTLVANDAGCLMQMAGGLKRQNVPVQARHIAEILASRE